MKASSKNNGRLSRFIILLIITAAFGANYAFLVRQRSIIPQDADTEPKTHTPLQSQLPKPVSLVQFSLTRDHQIQLPTNETQQIKLQSQLFMPKNGNVSPVERVVKESPRSTAVRKKIPSRKKMADNVALLDLSTRPLELTPPIIVGGTDGSGTRGAVTLLLSMGFFMLSDGGGADGGCQYDVHGKELHPAGWPPVVQRVLKSTHSAYYNLDDLPKQDYRETMAALSTMKSAYQHRVSREVSAAKKRNRYVRWGFKAPVSMYMVPFWARLFPGCNFIHIVRDGRDMSFHWLQSPVKRYWPHLFPDSMAALPPHQRRGSSLVPDKGSYQGRAYLYDVPKLNKAPHYRIAELWASSNLQVESIGLQLAAADGDGAGGYLGSFITLRSEDFVTTKNRFEGASSSLLRLVRPTLKEEEVCCLVNVHWDAEQQSEGWRKNIQNYGKWRKAIEKYGGVTKSARDPSSLYGGILERSKGTLEHFNYTNGERDEAIGDYDYYEMSGRLALNCSGTDLQSCPDANAHKQKCM